MKKTNNATKNKLNIQEPLSNNHRKVAADQFLKFFEKNGGIDILKNNIVIDVGCGDNKTKEFFEKIDMQWYGMDIKQSENLIIGDMNNMPFSDRFAHIIYCVHAYEHTEHPVQALKEFKRVLKPGGVIFLSTPYPTFGQIFGMDKTHINVLNEWQLTKLFKYTGIEIIKLVTIKPDLDNPSTWSIITVGNVV